MANASRDYTKPAIDQRIAELVKRRIGAREDLPTESTKERLVSTFFGSNSFADSLNICASSEEKRYRLQYLM